MSYRLEFGYWVGVLLVAAVTYLNLSEFGRPLRFFPSGWGREVVRLCESHSDVCDRLQIVDRRTWWSNKVGISVTARPGKEVQAHEVMNAGLNETGGQRDHIVFEVVPSSGVPQPIGDHQ
jgi:hypothetical protein